LIPVVEDALGGENCGTGPIHGDPKITNVMIDEITGKRTAIVDLDTVKPGLIEAREGTIRRILERYDASAGRFGVSSRSRMELTPDHAPLRTASGDLRVQDDGGQRAGPVCSQELIIRSKTHSWLISMKHFFPAPPTAAGLLSAAVLTLLAGTTCFAQNPDITVLQEDLQLGPMSVVSLAGSINVPRIVTLTVRNDGTSDLTGLAVSKGGPHASLFTVTQPGVTTLAAGNETTFDVTFTPTESGTRLATLQIGSNDPDENPTDLVLSGTIAAPDIALNSDSQAVLMDASSEPGTLL